VRYNFKNGAEHDAVKIETPVFSFPLTRETFSQQLETHLLQFCASSILSQDYLLLIPPCRRRRRQNR
jgi:hypothetical protein